MKKLSVLLLMTLLLFGLPAASTASAKPDRAHQDYVCHLALEYDDAGILTDAKYVVIRVDEHAWDGGHSTHAVVINDVTYTDQNLGPVANFEKKPKASDACPKLPDIEQT